MRFPGVSCVGMLAVLAISGFTLAGCADDDDAPPASPPPAAAQPLALSNGQAAEVVIGQADFTSSGYNRGATAAADTIAMPYGNPLVHAGILYLPDYGNNRVLGFHQIPTAHGASADFVIGQPDFVTTAANLAQGGMHGPQGVSVDQGRLFLTEYQNCRVGIYDPVPAAGPGRPAVVVGQADFSSKVLTGGSAGVVYPEAAFSVAGKLIVADTNNHRVLIWNSLPAANGAAADLVLGQDGFDRAVHNDDNQDAAPDATPSARTMYSPAGIWSDGTRLVVLDSYNNRVLIWTHFPTANFASADLVLGQGDFTHATANDDNQDGTADATPSARTLSYPYDGVDCRNGQLFVADNENHRILVWDTFPTASFAPADHVLGQADFVHNAANDADADGVSDPAPSAGTLAYPTGIHVAGRQLIVADNDNNRYLVYRAP